MKKLLAFIMAVTTCLCAFTACGDTEESEGKKADKSSSADSDSDDKDSDDDDKDSDDDEDSDDKKGSKEDSDDNKSEKDDVEIKNDKSDEEDDRDTPVSDTETKNPVSASDDVYLDLFKDFCENAMDKDTDALMKLTFPDKLIDALVKTNAYDFMVESIDGSYDAMEDIDLNVVEFSSVTDCDAATKSKLEKLYSVYSNLFICMAENDIMYDDMESGNIDEAKAMLILEPAMKLSQMDDIDNLDVDISIPFEEAKFVTFSAEGEDQKFVMYKVKGEDWKIDTIGLAFFGF